MLKIFGFLSLFNLNMFGRQSTRLKSDFYEALYWRNFKLHLDDLTWKIIVLFFIFPINLRPTDLNIHVSMYCLAWKVIRQRYGVQDTLNDIINENSKRACLLSKYPNFLSTTTKTLKNKSYSKVHPPIFPIYPDHFFSLFSLSSMLRSYRLSYFIRLLMSERLLTYSKSQCLHDFLTC